jgi:N-acetylneuraminate lyase
MPSPFRLTGLIAAVHTPFAADGSLHLAVVQKQAEHLLRQRVTTAFIAGSTGESQSLALDERLQLAERWFAVAKGTPLSIVVHVGGNCLPDARTLAGQAQRLGAAAIAALAPNYFKPRTVGELIDWCAAVASAAPDTPFYYYDIPILTGVSLPMPQFLEQAGASIPTLAGLKFTNNDLMAYQLCRRACQGRYDIAFGFDEMLLAALAVGADGAVGSSYNFAAPIYHRLIDAFHRHDLPAARDEQYKSIQLIATLARAGYLGAAKAVMAMLGVDVGPPRLPNAGLDLPAAAKLRESLETLGFFEWVKE